MDARDEAYRLGYGDECDETHQPERVGRSRELDRADEACAAAGDAWARERGISN